MDFTAARPKADINWVGGLEHETEGGDVNGTWHEVEVLSVKCEVLEWSGSGVLVESRVIVDVEDVLGDASWECCLLAYRFPIELDMAQLFGGIRKFAFDVGDEYLCALGIVGAHDQQGERLECGGELASL